MPDIACMKTREPRDKLFFATLSMQGNVTMKPISAPYKARDQKKSLWALSTSGDFGAALTGSLLKPWLWIAVAAASPPMNPAMSPTTGSETSSGRVMWLTLN